MILVGLVGGRSTTLQTRTVDNLLLRTRVWPSSPVKNIVASHLSKWFYSYGLSNTLAKTLRQNGLQSVRTVRGVLRISIASQVSPVHLSRCCEGAIHAGDRASLSIRSAVSFQHNSADINGGTRLANALYQLCLYSCLTIC